MGDRTDLPCRWSKASLASLVAAGGVFSYGDWTADDIREIGPGRSEHDVIAQHARDQRLTLLTADFDFADIRAYPPADYAGIVVVDRPENATAADVLAILGQFVVETTVLANLAGRLAIVDASRVRLRPALREGTT